MKTKPRFDFFRTRRAPDSPDRPSLLLSPFALRLSTLLPARPVYKTWWGAVCGLMLVAGGIAAGALTFLAGRANDPQLAYYGAIACLVSVVLIVLFVVPPLLRAARMEARAIDFPVRVTWGGVLFLVLLVLVALAAWNTNNNVLFLIFSMMVSTIFVQWAAGRAVLRDLGVAARFPDHIFAGEIVPVVASLHNFKRVLPSLFVSVEAREADYTFGAEREAAKDASPTRPLQAQHPLSHFEYVARRGRVDLRVEREFLRRGEISITGFTLSTVFPFGLFELRHRLRARDVRLVIYPQIETMRVRFNLPPRGRRGESLTPRRGQGANLFGLREYQPGDDRRHIDWKATARTRRLTVREFAADAPVRAHIVLDGANHGAPEEEWTRRFERGVTLTASLVAHFIRQGGDVALTIRGERAPAKFGSDQAHLYSLLRRLALLAPSATQTAPDTDPLESYNSLDAQTASQGAHLVLVTAAPTRDTLPHTAHVIGY